MSTKSAPRRRARQTDRSAWIIPAIVGLMVIAVVVGVILSIENRPPAVAGGRNISVPVTTVRPQPTNQPPYPNVPRISPTVAKERIDSGQAVLLDVRSKQAYDSQHAAGALSFPEEEIESRLQELPRDKELILYCT